MSLGLSRLHFGFGAATVIGVLLATWAVIVRNTDEPAEVREATTALAPPDPRDTFDTPFRNVRRGVKYVGDRECAACHADIARTYRQHPMGRSAAATPQASPIERYDVAAHNPFSALERFDFAVDRRTDRIAHRIAARDRSGTTLAEFELEATLAIGSGTRGRSYLVVRNGAAWQSPVSWFSEKKIWDVSPGYTADSHFQRAVSSNCLFCHTNQVESVPDSINRYREPIFQAQASIGCERCHGPGELHVAARKRGTGIAGIDTSIVNPRHLEAELRDAVCQQCHLQGETRVVRRGRDIFEFRPGLPLDEFVTVYLRHENLIDYGKSVGQFEQLRRSKCFIASGGQMSCTSCHDPHSTPAPETKIDYFRAKCVACHQRAECKLPIADRQVKSDNCAACHMSHSSSTTIAHTAITDHRILRTPAAAVAPPPRPIPEGEVPLTPFAMRKDRQSRPESDRDLGIALAKMMHAAPASAPEARELVMTMAENRLSDSLKRWPGDVPALEALAEIMIARFCPHEALKHLKTIIALIPDREHALARAIEPAVLTRDFDFAIACADKVVALNPSSIDHRLSRARLRMTLKQWAEAESDCRAALRENPTYVISRVMLATCRHHLGDEPGAHLELEKALGMLRDPSQELFLRNWFQATTR
jgi:predicted CXXCH cytochrome family protein